MPTLNVDDVLKAVGGRDVSGVKKVFTGISTDSRTVGKGELFVPLVGERFDGHDFLSAALESGAGGVLYQAGRKPPPAGAWAVVEVKNTLTALQDLARYVRNGREDLTVVGVTGTNGKTTTKEMLASILALKGPTLKNEGNFNNDIGLPLTMLRLAREHWAAVLEMGTSGPGEIALLASIARPTVGVITNIGPAHLEKLGSMEGVARAKGELIEALPDVGRAVLNFDDPYLKDLMVNNRERTVTFGLRPGAKVNALDIENVPGGISFKLSMPGGAGRVRLPVPGLHNVYNALAASAAALALGFSHKEITRGLEGFSPVKMRMEVLDIGGITVINDAYNANPASMAAALTTLGYYREGRRVAVLGDMLELGESAKKAHFDVGRLAGAEGLSMLVLLGEHAPDVAEGAVEAGMDEDSVRIVQDAEEAAGLLADKLKKSDYLLVKGSRKMKLEQVVDGLRSKRFS